MSRPAIHLLSQSSLDANHLGYSVIYELEDFLCGIGEVRKIKVVKAEKTAIERRLERIFRHSHYFLQEEISFSASGNILFVLSLTGKFLESLDALAPYLGGFDKKVVFLLDGFSIDNLRKQDVNYLKLFDVVLVPFEEYANKLQSLYSVAASYLPFGVDVLKYGEYKFGRGIDIVSYGRNFSEYVDFLDNLLNDAQSEYFLHLSTISSSRAENSRVHMRFHRKLLKNSKIALCFEASDIPRFEGQSFILYRWYECLAAGCNILGRRPLTPSYKKELGWPGSTIEIATDRRQWQQQVYELLGDKAGLLERSQRNYLESLKRHDLRLRLQRVFELLGLEQPPELSRQLDLLNDAIEQFDNQYYGGQRVECLR